MRPQDVQARSCLCAQSRARARVVDSGLFLLSLFSFHLFLLEVLLLHAHGGMVGAGQGAYSFRPTPSTLTASKVREFTSLSVCMSVPGKDSDHPCLS